MYACVQGTQILANYRSNSHIPAIVVSVCVSRPDPDRDTYSNNMATAAAMLIQAKPFRWNQAHTIRLHPVGRSLSSSDINYHNGGCAPKLKDLKLKSFFSEVEKNQSTKSKSKSGHACYLQSILDHPRNQLQVIANNSLRALRRSAIAAVLLGLLVIYNPKSNSALAAPMGWFGGRSPSYSSYSLSKYKHKNHDHPAMVAAFYFLIFILGSIFIYGSWDYTCDDDATWLKLKLFCLAVVLANIAWFRAQTNVVKLQVWLVAYMHAWININILLLIYIYIEYCLDRLY